MIHVHNVFCMYQMYESVYYMHTYYICIDRDRGSYTIHLS